MFSMVVADGKKSLYSFYVMPKYGKDIESYFQSQDKKISLASIVHLGIKVLEMLEVVHEAGYIYGDLKLDNILIGEGEDLPENGTTPTQNVFENVQLNLIDFGFASKYLDKQGMHLPETQVELFQGNLIFSSLG